MNTLMYVQVHKSFMVSWNVSPFEHIYIFVNVNMYVSLFRSCSYFIGVLPIRHVVCVWSCCKVGNLCNFPSATHIYYTNTFLFHFKQHVKIYDFRKKNFDIWEVTSQNTIYAYNNLSCSKTKQKSFTTEFTF